jgi:outer membrane protein OmpA-like peptidoglycan-associated protein
MRGNQVPVWIGAALVVLATSSGCATKGFVRTQVADLRKDTEDKNTALRADLDQVRGDGARALTAAGAAAMRADSSRSLALGNVDYREAARYQVYFAFDSAELDDAAKASLDQAAQEMDRSPQYLAELYGFADPRGTDSYNLQLAQLRANAVLRYLASRAPTQMVRYNAIGFGETPPDLERAAWGDDHAHQRQVLLVMVEKIPPSARRDALTSR